MRQGEPPNQEDSGAFPPVRVFLVLMTVVIAIGAVVLLTREDDPPTPRPTASPSPNFALTDAEAIARFKELHALSLKAGRTRDASLVDQVFSASGPTHKRALRAIDRLIEDNVQDRTRVRFEGIEVLSNTPDEIRLLEVSLVAPCFLTDAGVDVTNSPHLARQRTIWTLKEEGSVWLIHDSLLRRSEQLNRRRNNCG